MKQFIVVLLTIFTGLSSVCASLGDGDDKIDDLYGNLVERHLLDDGTVSVLYHKDRYLYFVIFAKMPAARRGYQITRRQNVDSSELITRPRQRTRIWLAARR